MATVRDEAIPHQPPTRHRMIQPPKTFQDRNMPTRSVVCTDCYISKIVNWVSVSDRGATWPP